jgi:hypothetical protein
VAIFQAGVAGSLRHTRLGTSMKELRGHLPWSNVDRRLQSMREIWIATTSPKNRPDASPVWFWWDGEAVYFTCAAVARKARNIAHEPEIVLLNGDGADPIIIKGRAEPIPRSSSASTRLTPRSTSHRPRANARPSSSKTITSIASGHDSSQRGHTPTPRRARTGSPARSFQIVDSTLPRSPRRCRTLLVLPWPEGLWRDLTGTTRAPRLAT